MRPRAWMMSMEAIREEFCPILGCTDAAEVQDILEERFAWVKFQGCKGTVERADRFLLKIDRMFL